MTTSGDGLLGGSSVRNLAGRGDKLVIGRRFARNNQRGAVFSVQS